MHSTKSEKYSISIKVGNDLAYILKKASKIMEITNKNKPYFVDFKIETIIEKNSVSIIYDHSETIESTELTSLDEDLRVRIVIDWLTALHKLHENGILHSNISPVTLRIKKEKHPVDNRYKYYGVLSGYAARFFDANYSPPIIYQPPEQLKGEQPDIRSDLYSLGITLYEIFTGTNPFYRHEEEKIKNLILTGKLQSIFMTHPTLESKIGKLIDRMIKHKRSERPNSALELIPFLGGKIERSIENPNLIYHPEFVDINNNIPYVLSKIKEKSNSGDTQIVIISGSFGSGKTILANQIGRLMEKNGYTFIKVQFPSLPWYQLTLINQINEGLKKEITLDLLAEVYTPVGITMMENAIKETRKNEIITSVTNFKIYSLLPAILKKLSQKTKLCLFIDDIHYSVLQQQFNLVKLFEAKTSNLCIIITVNEELSGGQRILNMLNPIYPNPIRIDLFKISPAIIDKITSTLPETVTEQLKFNENVYPARILIENTLKKRNTILTKKILRILRTLGTPFPLYVLTAILKPEFSEEEVFEELIELEKLGIIVSIYIEEENALAFVLTTNLLSPEITKTEFSCEPASLTLMPHSLWYLHLKLRGKSTPSIEEMNSVVKQFIHTPVAGFVLIILDEYQSKIEDLKIQTRIKYWMGVIAYTIGNDEIASIYLSEVVDNNTNGVLKREEKVWALLTIAWIKAREKDHVTSEYYLKKSLTYIDKQNEEEVARFKAILALLYLNQGNVNQAEQAIKEALNRKIRRFSEANLEVNAIAGNIYYYLTKFQESVKYFDEAIKIAKELRRTHLEAWLLRNISVPLSFIDPKKAIESINSCLDKYSKIGSIDEVCTVINNKAVTYFYTGKYKGSLEVAKQAYTTAEMSENLKNIAATLDTLAVAYLAHGEFKNAFNASEKAVDMIKKLEHLYSLFELLAVNIIIRYLGGYPYNDQLKSLLMLVPSVSSFPLSQELKDLKVVISLAEHPIENIKELTIKLFRSLKNPLFPLYRYYLVFLWLRSINQAIYKKIEFGVENFYNDYLHIAEEIHNPPLQKIMPLLFELLSRKKISQHQFMELYNSSPTNFIQYQIALLGVSLGERRHIPFVASLLKHYLEKIEPTNTESFLELFVKDTILEDLLPPGRNYTHRVKTFLNQISML